MYKIEVLIEEFEEFFHFVIKHQLAIACNHKSASFIRFDLVSALHCTYHLFNPIQTINLNAHKQILKRYGI